MRDVQVGLYERSLEAALLTSRPHAELPVPSGGFVYIVSERNSLVKAIDEQLH
jgi:hypothetical protein